MSKVVVLNPDMTVLGTTTWRRAICLVEKGRASVLAESDTKIHPKKFMPLVIRLIKAIRNLWSKKVPWNRRNVHTRDKFTCQYCGSRVDSSKITIDHVIPVSRGGKNGWTNTVSSCFDCNNKKGSNLPSEVGMSLIKKPVQPTIMEFVIQKVENEGLFKTLQDLGIY